MHITRDDEARAGEQQGRRAAPGVRVRSVPRLEDHGDARRPRPEEDPHPLLEHRHRFAQAAEHERGRFFLRRHIRGQ